MTDYKLSEIKQICTNQYNGCKTCPISKLCDSCFYDTIRLPWQWDLTELDNIEETFNTTSASTSDEPLIVEVNTPDEFIIYNKEGE